MESLWPLIYSAKMEIYSPGKLVLMYQEEEGGKTQIYTLPLLLSILLFPL